MHERDYRFFEDVLSNVKAFDICYEAKLFRGSKFLGLQVSSTKYVFTFSAGGPGKITLTEPGMILHIRKIFT